MRTLNQSVSEVIINQSNSLITFDTQLKSALSHSSVNFRNTVNAHYGLGLHTAYVTKSPGGLQFFSLG